jgi:hypothetical protein
MQEVIVFSDVEAWAVGYLATQLAARPEPYTIGVYVSNKVPHPRQARMVIVRRDGGPRNSLVTELVRLTVRVWAGNDADATDLTNMCRSLIAASPGESQIRTAEEIGGPVTIPDQSEQPQRLFTVQLTARSI